MVVLTTVFFTISLLGVTSTVYFLLADSVRKSDREVTERLAENYEHTFFKKGADALRQDVSPEFSVTILKESGEIEFEVVPVYIDRDFEDEDEIQQVQKEVAALPLQRGWRTILILSGEEDNNFMEGIFYRMRLMALKRDWSQILPLIDNDSFEILVTPVANGRWMKIGRSSENREEQLSRIRYIGFLVLFPFIFIGMLLSYFLSYQILSPIRGFARSIQKIREGDRDLRFRNRETGDEIDILAKEFNSLLDQNASLISHLKSVIDNVAHDLRTPLTRFRMSAEDALKNGSDPIRLRDALSDGLENSETILKLLKSIMDVSEAETQTLKFKQEDLYLDRILEAVIDLYQYTAEEKHITIRASLVSAKVKGDEARLIQAFGNILDNALKYSPASSQVGVTLETSETVATVSIKDQGEGIDASEQSRIWERLYRGDKARSTGGLGIGLSLVKAIILVHKGNVGVRNLVPRGCEFWVELPICHESERKS
jgi:signal transduction histidine kinase